jgi:hypothetical protein
VLNGTWQSRLAANRHATCSTRARNRSSTLRGLAR